MQQEQGYMRKIRRRVVIIIIFNYPALETVIPQDIFPLDGSFKQSKLVR